MFVEDIIVKVRNMVLFGHAPLLNDEWHKNFVCSICEQIERGAAMSTKQSAQTLRIIGLLRKQIVQAGLASETEIDNMLIDPSHRQPLYKSIYIPKEVRFIGGNMLAFRFKDRAITEKIKALGYLERNRWLPDPHRHFQHTALRENMLPHRPRFEWLHKIWIVPVYRHNVPHIFELITKHRFHMDDMTVKYLNLVRQSADRPSLFATDGEVILGNVCDNPLLSGWITEIAGGLGI
jgi:hypothetical protein